MYCFTALSFTLLKALSYILVTHLQTTFVRTGHHLEFLEDPPHSGCHVALLTALLTTVKSQELPMTLYEDGIITY